MDTPFLTETIHELHDIEGLVERHRLRLQKTVDQVLATGQELVFVASDLLGHVDIFYELAIMRIHGDLLRIVDVVDDEVAIGTCDDADIVAHTGGTR